MYFIFFVFLLSVFEGDNIAPLSFADWADLLEACHSMSKPRSSRREPVKQHAYEIVCIIIRLKMPGKRYRSLNMMKQCFYTGTLHPNDVGRISMQCFDTFLTSIQGCTDVIGLHRRRHNVVKTVCAYLKKKKKKKKNR